MESDLVAGDYVLCGPSHGYQSEYVRRVICARPCSPGLMRSAMVPVAQFPEARMLLVRDRRGNTVDLTWWPRKCWVRKLTPLETICFETDRGGIDG